MRINSNSRVLSFCYFSELGLRQAKRFSTRRPAPFQREEGRAEVASILEAFAGM